MSHNPEKIREYLDDRGSSINWRIECFEEIDSTNSYLMGHPECSYRACLADQQSAGRGRRGRAWGAKKGGAILMSMSWSLNGGVPIGLSLVSGIAVVRALRESGLSSAELKWPNDVLVDGQKLCGILVELTSNRCVIGIGLNLDLGDGPGVDVDYPWTDFVRLDLDFDRDRIAADLMFHHEILVKQCLNSGFAGFVDDWNALHYFKNKTVEVSKDGETFCGRALGVDKLGTLIVETKEGLRQLSSAEFKVRVQ